MKKMLFFLGILCALSVKSNPLIADEPSRVKELDKNVKDLSNLSLSEESIKTGKEVEILMLHLSSFEQMRSTKNAILDEFRRGRESFPFRGTETYQSDLKSIWMQVARLQKALEKSNKRPSPPTPTKKTVLFEDPPVNDEDGVNIPEIEREIGYCSGRLNTQLANEISHVNRIVSDYRSALQRIISQVELLNTPGIPTSKIPSSFVSQPMFAFVPQSFAPQSFVPQSFVPQAFPLSSQKGAGALQPLSFLVSVESFLSKASNVPRILSEKEYDQANTELASFPQKVEKIVSSEDLRLTEKKADDLFKQIATQLKSELEIRNKNRETLSSELARRDGILTQLEINKLLVYAVYGMIIAIVVAILYFALSTWWNREKAGRSDDRVLYELLGMGFLMLTVIILGTGKLLQAEGLASLLGTIAGYIFGRKAAEMAASAGAGNRLPPGQSPANPGSVAPASASPGAPTPAPPNPALIVAGSASSGPIAPTPGPNHNN